MISNEKMVTVMKMLGMSNQDILFILRGPGVEKGSGYQILSILWFALTIEFPHASWSEIKSKWEEEPARNTLKNLIEAENRNIPAIKNAVKTICLNLRELERKKIKMVNLAMQGHVNLKSSDFP